MDFLRRPQPQRTPQPPGPLAGYAQMIDDVLQQQFGIAPQQARQPTSDQEYGWRFTSGSALVEVYLIRVQDRTYMQVLSPLFHLPMTNLIGLYRKMLELNLTLTNAALGVFADIVYVFYERPTEGLGPEETVNIITLVTGYADRYDNLLVNEFGGRLYGQA